MGMGVIFGREILYDLPVKSMNPRCQILVEYAKWTALSAVKAGCPIKSRKTVYQLLNDVAFAEVLSGEAKISKDDFDAWHRRETETLCCRATALKPEGKPFPVGWSAKLINVYLKTAVYVGDLGREGLRDALHPPLDNRLKKKLKKHFKGRRDMVQKVDFGAIKHIMRYEQYREVIAACTVAADDLHCSLLEVDQLWSS